MLFPLTINQAQLIMIALIELRRHRPDLAPSIANLIDVFELRTCALELDRLHDELGRAYSSTWHERVDALEQAVHDLTLSVTRLETLAGETTP